MLHEVANATRVGQPAELAGAYRFAAERASIGLTANVDDKPLRYAFCLQADCVRKCLEALYHNAPAVLPKLIWDERLCLEKLQHSSQLATGLEQQERAVGMGCNGTRVRPSAGSAKMREAVHKPP